MFHGATQHVGPLAGHRGPILAWLIATACLGAAPGAIGAELVVVDQAGCPYCERFEMEVAPAWPRTDEGRSAPLRRVNLHEPWPDDLVAVRRAQVTPTFILVDDGREIDRLVGYPGDEHFWFLIGELLARLDEAPGKAREVVAGTEDASRHSDGDPADLDGSD